jgi:glucuronate isomerase
MTREESGSAALIVEDAQSLLNKLLEGAEQSVSETDWKKRTIITMGKDKARRLQWVINLLRNNQS